MTLQLLTAFLAVASAQAATVSLNGDYSIANGNPNGQWIYRDGGTVLTLQVPLDNGNAARPALAAGYWGVGNNLNSDTPDFGKAQVNGSAAGGSDLDYLAGDIIAHSPNSGSSLLLNWTAPSDGSVANLALLVWYAHSPVTRSNDYVLKDGGTALTSGVVSSNVFSDRDHAASYMNAGFDVVAGDLISFALTKTAGQDFGSLAGISLNFDFTPAQAEAPEPATLSFMALGLLTLAGFGRRRFRRF